MRSVPRPTLVCAGYLTLIALLSIYERFTGFRFWVHNLDYILPVVFGLLAGVVAIRSRQLSRVLERVAVY